MKFLSLVAYWVIRALAVAAAHIVFPAKVIGKEYTKIDDPFIFCSNHLSMLDPVVLVGAVLSRKAYFMGKDELYRTKIGNWLFRSLYSFPVVRGTADMTAIRKSIKCLNDGYDMMIFPEGTRNLKKDGSMLELHDGVGIIALNTKCKIVPCYIDSVGGYKPFRRFEVRVGEPIDISEYQKKGLSKENLNNVMAVLKEKMQKLM